MRTQEYDYKPKEVNISEIRSMKYLINQYPGRDVIPQFKKLELTYPYYRAVRGDGNCFYRAIAFLYLRQTNLNHFSKVFQNIQNVCIGHPLEFEGQTFQRRLHKIYEDFLVPLRDTNSIYRQKGLAECFNKSLVFDTMMILYFRSLNYKYIKLHENEFVNYISSRQAVENIKIYARDSEGIQYFAMANALNIKLDIKITDEYDLKSQVYNDSQSGKSYDIFFRPGHFDILYHQNSQYLKIESDYHNFFYTSPKRHQYQDPYRNKNDYTFQYRQSNRKNNLLRQESNYFTSIPQNRYYSIQTPQEKSRQQSQDYSSNLKNHSPFISMNSLRQKQLKQNKSQDRSTKQETARQTSRESKIFQQKKPVPIQKYKAWQNVKTAESEPLKKLKQILVIILFFGTLGFIVYKI